MMNSLRPEDYEKLYEDGLLKLNQAVEALATLTAPLSLSSSQDDGDDNKEDDDNNNNNNNNKAVKDEPKVPSREEQQACARILLARANMDGILQQQANSKISSHRLRATADAFLHQWRIHQAQHSSRQTEQVIIGGSLRCKGGRQRATKTKETLLKALHNNGTVDDFFEAYPEAMRNNNDDDGESDEESSSSSGDKKDISPTRRNAKSKKGGNQSIDTDHQVQVFEKQQQQPLAAPRQSVNPYARNQSQDRSAKPIVAVNDNTRTVTEGVGGQQRHHQLSDNNNNNNNNSRPSSSSSQRSNTGFQYTPVDLTGDSTVEENTNNWRPNNLHSSQRYAPHQGLPPPPHHQPQQQHQRNPYQNRRPQGPPQPPPQQDHSSWDDHQRQNPFQTAREFSSVVGNDRGRSHPQQPPQQQDRQYNQQNNYNPPQQAGRNNVMTQQNINNPYSTRPPSPPPPEAPGIRDSLKRKFQAPVKRSQTTSEQSGMQRQEKKVASNSSSSNENGEDEDELPEELKRYGKDLVEKILNEIVDAGDPITFDDIAGLHDAKQTIQEVICWPMKRPDLFTGLRKAPNGLLLYGPPGTGKTLIGKAIAHESGATFFSISSSSLTSKWIGEGEKLVRTMFAVAAYREPSVVFIDEIDSLLTQRKSDENEASRRIKTEFLVQLDGTGTTAQGRVLTIGATNRPQELDEAARRRFVKRLYIPLPVESDRQTLLEVLLAKNNHRLTPVDVSKLAKETDGYSGADLKSLCADAAMGPIRQLGAKALEVEATDVPPISYKHFRQSLRSMKPSVAPDDLVQYIEWDKIYGSKRVEEDLDADSSEEEED